MSAEAMIKTVLVTSFLEAIRKDNNDPRLEHNFGPAVVAWFADTAASVAEPSGKPLNNPLRSILLAARSALRSYEYGNGSPDLAKAIADKCDEALK